MKPPFIRRPRTTRLKSPRHSERGVTMVLVAVSMVAIIAIAALSIDVITLYLVREEAQRSADAAALAGARVLSLSGVTGDPSNAIGSLPSAPWPSACSVATQVAQAVANQNSIGNNAANTVTVNFVYNGTSSAGCTSFGGSGQFAINPQVQVQVNRQGLPTFFSRIWRGGTNSVSATATAEAFNSSNSGSITASGIVPVNPHCVKPWIIPNKDPANGGAPFVSLLDGSINNQGIQYSGVGPGVIGETFTLADACSGADCTNMYLNAPAAGNYVPSYIQSASKAVSTCSDDTLYEEAIGGCDQGTAYACGTVGGSQADLSINPGGIGGDTSNGTQCLIHQTAGFDTLDTGTFPYRIQAGSGNPLGITGNVTSSSSIVTIPIYDSTANFPNNVPHPTITIVGFLQVFINRVTLTGDPNVTILNVSGCSNTAPNPAVAGSSPVPVRLITPQ